MNLLEGLYTLADFINPNDNKPYQGLNLEVHDENKNVIGKYLPNEQTGTFTHFRNG